MEIFNKEYCIDICLKNENKYVRLAVEDLANDLSRVNAFKGVAQLISEDELCGDMTEAFITDNSYFYALISDGMGSGEDGVEQAVYRQSEIQRDRVLKKRR